VSRPLIELHSRAGLPSFDHLRDMRSLLPLLYESAPYCRSSQKSEDAKFGAHRVDAQVSSGALSPRKVGISQALNFGSPIRLPQAMGRLSRSGVES
jgi:hypothetical protein